MNLRRTVLSFSLLAATALLAAAGPAQDPVLLPSPPKKGPTEHTEPATETPDLPSPDKRILEENEKDIKKKVQRLFQLSSELKAEVDKTDSSKVLSLNLIKKAEEIEKLAREIKNRSKG